MNNHVRRRRLLRYQVSRVNREQASKKGASSSLLVLFHSVLLRGFLYCLFIVRGA